MNILSMGKYSGEIIQQVMADDIIVTNTVYSLQENNPDWHSHENLHVCLVFQRGKAETKSTTKFTEKSGSIFFYHADEKHRWLTADSVSKSINIEIGLDFLKKYNITEEQIKDAIEESFGAKSLILKIQKEIMLNEIESDLAIQSLLLELVAPPTLKTAGNRPQWVIRLSDLLEDNWNEEMKLAEIAQILQVHAVTISKNFRRYFGCTLGEYRRKLKVEKSIGLIKTSEDSLSQIAFHCGFADQSHFIRNFKTNTGFLPKDFRKY